MHKALVMIPENCTNCSQCEMMCSYELTGVFNAPKSRIKIFPFSEPDRNVPFTCTQCEEAWCMRACPVEAITVDESTGAKIVTEARCVGCKVCTIACPFGTINYDFDSGKVTKCDLCGGDPACVKVCPQDAIHFVDVNVTGQQRMRDSAEQLK